MTITATREDEVVSTDKGIQDLCKLMQWDSNDIPQLLPFTYQGYRVHAKMHVAKGVYSDHVGKPWKRSSVARLAKSHLGYTDSLRPMNETCGTCVFRVERYCTKGGFVTKVNSGCDEWG
jgi:hypothetical protein